MKNEEKNNDIKTDKDSPEIAISLENISKRFNLHKQKPFFLREVFKRILNKKSKTNEFWALHDATFNIKKGESVGIIGSNGAGKSTLLGITAGAIYPTSGNIRVNGRIGALLELGAGFHPDLTGRENIFLNASLLGLSKEETLEQFDNILEFSELGEFIDVQIRNYSSGMHVRLGFSVAVHIKPEILLMDEALSVGDQHFQHKCQERILSFKEKGKTLLFVSHGLESVESLCNRVIWFEHGRIKIDGPAEETISAYIEASK